jgi:hypothetical protein
MACVVCGAPESWDHKCDPVVEAKIEGARKAAGTRFDSERKLTEAHRLNVGLAIFFGETEDVTTYGSRSN